MLHLKIIVTVSHIHLKGSLKYLQTCLNASINVATEKYYHNTVNKLMNTQQNYIVYWSLLNIFLNNKKIILYLHYFIKIASCVILRKKSNFLLFFFSKQCSVMASSLLYFGFVMKYLKDLFLAKCLSIYPLINSSLKNSLVSNPVIPVSTNCYQLPKKFSHLMIAD